jgi:probable HAF family extracellular repeat protein
MGQIVGHYSDASGHGHGFLLSGGTYITLDDPLGTDTFAKGINNAGQIVGYYSNASGTHGFVYSGGFYTTLDDPSATVNTTLAWGINDAGQVVGEYFGGSFHGFLEIAMPNPPPPVGTLADMILRASNTSPIAGQYEIYDIGNNAILSGNSLGQVGTDWAFVTLGGFFGSDTTDMLLRNSKTGGFEVYDISNNNLTNAGLLGNVGLDWQVMGFGNLSSRGETDGGVEVYDISNNQLTGAALMGRSG